MTFPCMPLGEISVLQAGFGFPPELQGRTKGDYPFAKVGDISRCGRSSSSVLSDADHYVDTADLATLKAKVVPAGSVLFAKIGEAIRQNHRVLAGCELLIDNNAMAAIPSDKVDGRFLYHFLKTVDFYKLAPATTVPALRKSDLEKLLIPCPPLPEQRRIAAILDQADALRAKRREALAQLDSLTQSIFMEMFEGDRKLPQLELRDLCELITDGTHYTPTYADEGTIFLSAKNVTSGYVDWVNIKYIPEALHLELQKRVAPRRGDVLLAKNGTTGIAAIVDRECVFDIYVSLALLRPSSEVLSTYLHAAIILL